MSSEDSILHSPVSGDGAWRGVDMERDSALWQYHLTPRYLEEIDAAVRGLRRSGRTLNTVTRSDFSFPTFSVFLKRLLWNDVAGRGFCVIRGLPVEDYSVEELEMLYWGIGLHMGVGVSQNAEGHRVGHVRSQGKDYNALNVRGYQTNAELPYHCDPSDVVGLLCVQTAKEGGESSIISGLSIYNAVLAERPQFLPMLYKGFVYDRRGEETYFQKPISDPVPVFAHVDGELSIRYVRKSMETAREKLGQPFSDEELEVLDYIDSVTMRRELQLRYTLAQGDIQFVNNYTVLHSRTDYVDFDEPARRRHMLRLWLKVPGFRKLDPDLIEFDEASGWSRREGILPPNAPMPKTVPDPLFV
ncbi:TauD/TfdA family dioxygenase [Aquibaculum sediminis]|uniref:TauD/TfdA family dioxygenase n=1 Tax=Aquibaculum sediminis TaxID=3231907 RepID=UPI003452312E